MEKKNNVSKNTNATKKNNSSKSNNSAKKNNSSKVNKVTSKSKEQNNIKETKINTNNNQITEVNNKMKNNQSVKENKNINVNKKFQSNNDISGDFGGSEIRKLLIIIGAVCAVMLAFYFITEVVLKNKKDDNKDPEIKLEPIIQYEQILMGSLFNQNENDYYVFVYDEDDILVDIYNQYLSTYKNSSDPVKVYKVNLSEDFNKSYIGEESYLNGSDITKIKVTGTTLIRISDGEIYRAFEGYDEIIGRLKFMLE